MFHFNNSRYALGSPKPQNRDFSRVWHRVAIHCHNFKNMVGQRQAADLGCTAVQDMKEYAFALLNAYWLAVPKLFAVYGEYFIPNFEPFWYRGSFFFCLLAHFL